jgi:nitrogenase subunit NifH
MKKAAKAYGKHGNQKSSMPQNTATGSGSRPMASKVKIQTTEPKHDHTMERAPKGWLK